MKLPVERSNVFIHKKFKNEEEYFDSMSNFLEKHDLVTNEYRKAILDREENFPTGLEIGDINIAIPHTDYIYSKTNTICVTTLENAVKFKRMDDSSKSVNVKIILQLLFDKPDKQVTLLKELMAKVTDQNFLQKLVKEKNEENIVKLFNDVD